MVTVIPTDYLKAAGHAKFALLIASNPNLLPEPAIDDLHDALRKLAREIYVAGFIDGAVHLAEEVAR